MEKSRSEIAKAASFKRNYCCPQCGQAVEEVDGKEVGGFPGIVYKRCNGCGWCMAKTKRPRKSDNPLFDKR